MAKLRAAIILLANDDCVVTHKIADEIIRQVWSLRWRMESHRERSARSVEHMQEWLASQSVEIMVNHKHRPVDSKTVHGPYMGPLAGRYTNPVARGDRTRTDFCRCGGKRYTNTNGGQQEIGRWHEQLKLNLNQSSDEPKPQTTDGAFTPKCSIPTGERQKTFQQMQQSNPLTFQGQEQYFPVDYTLAKPTDPDSPEARRSRFKVV